MRSRDRVIAAINGQEVDHVPVSFSYHFPAGNEFGEPGVNAHIRFFEETDVDIYKIMNENLVPYMGNIKVPDDWKQIHSFTLKDEFMIHQIDMVKRILDRCKTDHVTMGTLHGVLASCIHPIESMYGFDAVRELMCAHYREKKQPIMDAFSRIADSMALLAEQYITLGVDAVMYAALGGEDCYFTDEEFTDLVAPLDKMIMGSVKSAGGYCFLHICKKNLAMNRYESYTDFFDVVNWGVYEVPMTLEQGKAIFPGKTVMGGLANRSGILVEGSIEELQLIVKEIIVGMGKVNFILGADCTLPTNLSSERIRAAVMAAREI